MVANAEYKILIAEDDSTSLRYLKIVLKSVAENTLTAANGEEVVEQFRKNPDIDLILMDLKMPLMNGLEATREIRKLDQDVIIIAQTAYALEGDKELALSEGCNDYISKPIRKKVLLEMIEKYLPKQKK